MIYHIAERDDWAAAQQRGSYRAASLASDGFIHCSTWQQVRLVVKDFYRGRSDLLLLSIDESRLHAPLIWEAATHPDPASAEFTVRAGAFPHIYGVINLDAVRAVASLREELDGFDSA
ncbi:MAG: DUF952 domain-containing protein [Chloroflexi bacterium]|nr:DUF952 domain-containing protein [Chloroflexota bacterium]MCY4246622.1 DUF952 domain-containing protein [Chloroflexota bacterium]